MASISAMPDHRVDRLADDVEVGVVRDVAAGHRLEREEAEADQPERGEQQQRVEAEDAGALGGAAGAALVERAGIGVGDHQ